MRAIMISTDRNLFKPGSAVRERLVQLAAQYEELTIIVFALRSLGLREFNLAANIKVIPTNSTSRLNYIWDAMKIGKKLKEINFVTAQDPFETGLVGKFLAHHFKAKLELQIHTDFLSPYFVQHSFLNRLRVVIARWTLPQADYIRVVSERIKESLKAKSWELKAIIEVRPIAIDLEKLKQVPITVDLHQKYPQFKKIILMASRLEPEKQIDLAIKNLAKFLLETKSVGLVIVGSGSEDRKLKDLVTELNLADYVKFEGWQDNLATYCKTADLFLITSRYEGYGVAIVEALACGLLVVSTDVGVAHEMGATIITLDTLVPIISHLLSL